MKAWINKMREYFTRGDTVQDIPESIVDQWGRGCFPRGITDILNHTFDGNSNLRTAVLPQTVKRLGDRCFADCGNLSKLKLNEGLEEVCHNVFTGCESLKSIVFPDSVAKVEAFAFYNSSFESPVFNASGDILYRCPEVADRKKYTIPRKVRHIQAGAFLYHKNLEEVIILESVEYIHCRSFLGTGIRRLTIPASVKCVEAKSFWGCEELEEVVVLCDISALAPAAFFDCPKVKLVTPGQHLTFEESRHIRGLSILSLDYHLNPPKQDL